MTPDDFNRAFEYVVQNEGYYVNDPVDRGGPTKYGITITTLSTWRKVACSPEDVQTLTRDEAKAIYQAAYWDALNCNSLSQLPIATALFDMSVLFGVHRATLYAQMAVDMVTNENMIPVDGIMGHETSAALNDVDTGDFLEDFTSLFLRRVALVATDHPEQLKFKNGWENRINRLLTLKP